MKLIIENTASGTTISLIDEISPPQQVCRVNGKTLKDAARWLVRRVNRIADQAEERLIELGLLTDDEIEEILTTLQREREEGVPGENA